MAHIRKRYTNTYSGYKNTFRKIAQDGENAFKDIIDEFEEMDKYRLPDGTLPDWYLDKHK